MISVTSNLREANYSLNLSMILIFMGISLHLALMSLNKVLTSDMHFIVSRGLYSLKNCFCSSNPLPSCSSFDSLKRGGFYYCCVSGTRCYSMHFYRSRVGSCIRYSIEVNLRVWPSNNNFRVSISSFWLGRKSDEGWSSVNSSFLLSYSMFSLAMSIYKN